MEYCVKNETESDIVIEMGVDYDNLKSIAVSAGDTATIHYFSYEGGCGDGADYPYPDSPMLSFDMIINGKPMAPSIGKRKYWDFQSGSGWSIFTLKITDELLNNPEFDYYIGEYTMKNGASAKISIEDYFSMSWLEPGEKMSKKTASEEESWISPPWYGSLIITMGDKQVIQNVGPNDPLFRNETYTLVSEDAFIKNYEFTFTDEFFANGVPVE